MDKLTKIRTLSLLKQMAKTGEQSKAAMKSGIDTMHKSGIFSEQDIENLVKVERYLGDVNRVFGNLQQAMQK